MTSKRREKFLRAPIIRRQKPFKLSNRGSGKVEERRGAEALSGEEGQMSSPGEVTFDLLASEQKQIFTQQLLNFASPSGY